LFIRDVFSDPILNNKAYGNKKKNDDQNKSVDMAKEQSHNRICKQQQSRQDTSERKRSCVERLFLESHEDKSRHIEYDDQNQQVEDYIIGGKTGTAEVSGDKGVEAHAWFTGFVYHEDHPLAICIILKKAGSGGSIAAPIAGKILEKAIELGY